MARWQLGARYEKRAKKALTVDQRRRAMTYLQKLSGEPVPGNLNFKPMQGQNGEIWECKAGGQFRFLLRRTEDAEGTLYIVENVGPHDIYNTV